VKDNIKLSIVIPVYNGEKSIGQLVDKLVQELSMFDLEIVLVNDHSPDNSEKICIEAQKKYSNIVSLYSLAKNVGEHNAVMAGLNNTTGDYVAIMDDDFQNPPKEVIKLVSTAMENNYDVVYSYFESKKHSTFRNLGSWFNDKVANILLDKPKDLYLSSFKLMNRFVVNEIIKYESPFSYIDGLILQITDNIGKVKVEHSERMEGKSSYTLKKLVSLWLNMFTSFSTIPLRVSVYLGFIFSFIGVAYIIISIIEKIINPDIAPGYTSLITIILIFSGVQLISVGIIGEYVGRIFIAQNKKPQYTIKNKFVREK